MIPIIIKRNKTLIFLFKFLIFLDITEYSKMFVCNDKDRPLLKGDNCVSSCTTEEIKEEICKIENKIIQTQWLNNIIYFRYENYTYTNFRKK